MCDVAAAVCHSQRDEFGIATARYRTSRHLCQVVSRCNFKFTQCICVGGVLRCCDGQSCCIGLFDFSDLRSHSLQTIQVARNVRTRIFDLYGGHIAIGQHLLGFGCAQPTHSGAESTRDFVDQVRLVKILRTGHVDGATRVSQLDAGQFFTQCIQIVQFGIYAVGCIRDRYRHYFAIGRQ